MNIVSLNEEIIIYPPVYDFQGEVYFSTASAAQIYAQVIIVFLSESTIISVYPKLHSRNEGLTSK